MTQNPKNPQTASLILKAGLALALVIGTSSCSTNPFDEGYQAVSSLPPRKVKNPSPRIIEVPAHEHEKNVREQIGQGAFLIGYSEKRSQESISVEQARLFAIKKNAYVAVFSKEFTGNSTQYQPVPLQSEKIENQKNTKRTNSSTRTSIGYREYQLPVWLHRVSLLRFPDNYMPPPPPAPTVKAPPKKALVKKATAKPKEEPVIYETIKTIETTKDFKPKISGDP
jgi:hypothetical protein